MIQHFIFVLNLKYKIMKTRKGKKEIKKFDLDKMEVAKLKNMHLIIGGGGGDDPIDTNDKKIGSSRDCAQSN